MKTNMRLVTEMTGDECVEMIDKIINEFVDRTAPDDTPTINGNCYAIMGMCILAQRQGLIMDALSAYWTFSDEYVAKVKAKKED